MGELFIESQTFEAADLSAKPLARGEYEKCTFRNCDFSNGDFTGFKFIDCVFSNCNLSVVKLGRTVLRDVIFDQCKMLGLRFENCSEFGLLFTCTQSILNHCSFYGIKIRKTKFNQCQMQECDFTNADMASSVFDDCDLTNSAFENTNLEKCDLSSAYGFSIDPELNYLKKARVSVRGLPGLLGKHSLDIVE